MKEDKFVDQMEAARGRIQDWYDRAQQRAAGVASDPHDPLLEAFDEFRTTLEELEVAEEELRQQYEELQATRDAVEVERYRYQELFDYAPDAYLVTTMGGIIREANRAAARLLNVRAGFLAGKPLHLYLAEPSRREFDAAIDRVLHRLPGEEWIVTLNPRRDPMAAEEEPGPESTTAAVTAIAVRGARGEAIGIRWLLRDITDRQRAEDEIRTLNATLETRIGERTRQLEVAHDAQQKLLAREQAARAQAEAAQSRFAFLSEASALLAGTLDYPATLATIVRLPLPRYADWCTVDLLEDGDLHEAALAHVDPAKEAMARDLRARYPPRRDLSHGRWHVMRTGESVIMADVGAELWTAEGQDTEHMELLRAMNTRSFLRVPLRARGQTFGVLSVGYEGERRRYHRTELILIEELVRRAAVAIDNARLYREAQVANAAKDRFLAVLSHELRTPLTPIQATAEMLRRIADDPTRVRSAADVLERNARLQASLVNDLLDLSRITQGRIRVECEPTALGPLIDETLAGLRETAMDAGLTLVWRLPAEAVGAAVDPFRMQQVLLNLVQNAVKYTPRGGQITVELARDGDEARVSVSDTGAGIAPDALSRIFQIFHQEQSGAERKGLGIGLALVSSLVAMHGGRVWAESEGIGHGSRFIVCLPACEPPTLQAPGSGLEPGARSLEPGEADVLLVEDNPDSRDAFREMLELLGYHVRVAASAEDALNVLREWRPDIILSDIGLPGLSGLELIRAVRRQKRNAGVAALAITGYGAATDRDHALSAGFDGHVVKPIVMEDLDRQMRALLRERSPV